MHDLFQVVLRHRDLSKAGDLFSVDDQAIVSDLSDVLSRVQEITSASDYQNSDNDQSVVEICITRVTTCIRETGTIEQHAPALVNLLEACLHHDLKPSHKDEDPPHAKIAADIISCIFLNYTKKDVMRIAVPVAVKFLHKGNKELSRNLSSYLSLAALHNAELLAMHIQPIIDSIICGNYSLSRVLPQIYTVNTEPIHEHVMALVSLLPLCDTQEKHSLLSLFHLISKNEPSLLEPCIPQLCECLAISATSAATLAIFCDMASVRPQPFSEHVNKMKSTVEQQPHTLIYGARVMGTVGRISQEKGRDIVDYLVHQLSESDQNAQPVLLKEIKGVCERYPALLKQHIPLIVKFADSRSSMARVYVKQLRDSYSASIPATLKAARSHGSMNQALGGVTVVQVGHSINRSMGKLVASSHQSMGHLMTTPAVSCHVSSRGGTQNTNRSITAIGGGHAMMNPSCSKLQLVTHCSGVTVTTSRPISYHMSGSLSASREDRHGTSVESTSTSQHMDKPESLGGSNALVSSSLLLSQSGINAFVSAQQQQQHHHHHYHHQPPPPPLIITARPMRNLMLPSATNSSPASSSVAEQRVSVFEPSPMRDAVQHFCEKHLDKIKLYMLKLCVRLPLPVKCTIEERKSKKRAKLYFSCQGRGGHCLYGKTFFTMKTRNPRLWIHLKFLGLQARATNALSTRDNAVSSLKTCWDILKADNKSFLTLVTSAFPSAKDQDNLMEELQSARYFDVFEYNGIETHWGCFLCNHPDKANGLVQQGGEPFMEGQLKEKKCKWRIFKRWRTRYFTLSAAQLSYRVAKSDDKESEQLFPISLSEIRSVRAVGGGGGRAARNIPKAFEIFTSEKTYILKAQDSRKAEQWVQCLSIAVAHSQAKGTC